MTVTIEHIGFQLIETTNKASTGKEVAPDKIEVHYLAFPSSEHEVRGMITLPYSEHIYLPEIIRRIKIQLMLTP